MAKKKKKLAAAVAVSVASRVKDVIRKQGLRSDGGLPDAVNVKILDMLKNAGGRCKANRRSTVRPHDL